MMQQGEATESPQPVAPEESLYRGVIDCWLVPDKESGARRLSSAAFTSRAGPLSVDIASRTTPEESLQRGRMFVALASFSAALPIELGYKVWEDPVFGCPDMEDNPAHAIIIGPPGQEWPIKKSHAKMLARGCSWAVPPPATD